MSEVLPGYHGISHQGYFFKLLNITENPFAFDPTLPDTGCSSSASSQDQHLLSERPRPPKRRDTSTRLHPEDE